jgi:hypothetical protein
MGKKKGRGVIPEFLKVEKGGEPDNDTSGVITIDGKNIKIISELKIYLGVQEDGSQWAHIVGHAGSTSGAPVFLDMKSCMVLVSNFMTHFIKGIEFDDAGAGGLDLPAAGIQIPQAPGNS